MRTSKKIDDEIRIKILDALLKKRSVVPNIRQLKKYTGYHMATIKSSLDFLKKEGVLESFGPKINFRKFGYNLEAKVMFQIDASEKKAFKKFLDHVQKDSNLFRLSAIIGSGNWNLYSSHLYKDIESYHRDSMKKYYESIPGIFKLIKDKQIFYATEPVYKNASRTKSIIEIIKEEKGYD